MKRCFPLLFLACASLPQVAPAHVHGEARLEIVLEISREGAQKSAQLTITLDTPLDNLLGFEYAPATDAEREAAASMEKQLSHPEQLFVPDAAAQCAVTLFELESPLRTEAPKNEHDHGDKHHHEHGEHHEHHEHGGHDDLEAHYRFTCKNPDALQGLKVRLFALFPRLQHLQVEFAGPNGQRAAKLDAKNTRFSW
ncbi:MAG: DUF2796 domain-containing protein [Candidatus Accumulibacter sp.]|jgi:hypothetical protein|nr:DUF2796 domain-containing protein [Accumulibacter sp.]